jgi:hypothetical protein
MKIALKTPGLHFDETIHRYTLDGQQLPSVTQVLRLNGLSDDFSHVNKPTLDRARDLGIAIHAATHYWDEGTLDQATVAPEVAPYLAAWIQFCAERRIQIDEMEQRLAHPLYRYAGTLDRIATGETARGRKRIVLDIKKGDPKAAGANYQTSAYQELYRQNHNEIIPERWSVQLHPDRAIPYTVTEYRETRDWRVFRSALDITFARLDRGNHWASAA